MILPLEIALERLGDKAQFLDQLTYVGWKKKAKFNCPKYGSWFTLPKYVSEGHWHPRAGYIDVSSISRVSYDEALARIQAVIPGITLSRSDYIAFTKPCKTIHPIHGVWITRPSTIARGHLHPIDGDKNRINRCIEKYGKQSSLPESKPGAQSNSFIDLTGQRFGKLTTIEPTQSKPIKWKCSCECGNIVNVLTAKLRNGQTTSCGCKRKETLVNISNTSRKQHIGEKYNKWTVVSVSHINGYIRARCDCSTERDVSLFNIIKGISKSCGCATKAYKRESECRSILEKISGYPWSKTRIAHGDSYFELDGLCKNLNAAFEYDGEQHYLPIRFGSNSHSLEKRQERDRMKDKECANRGIKLIRIPYYIEDLEGFITAELAALIYSKVKENEETE